MGTATATLSGRFEHDGVRAPTDTENPALPFFQNSRESDYRRTETSFSRTPRLPPENVILVRGCRTIASSDRTDILIVSFSEESPMYSKKTRLYFYGYAFFLLMAIVGVIAAFLYEEPLLGASGPLAYFISLTFLKFCVERAVTEHVD